MKLRVRLGKCTSRLELDGDAPTLADLAIRIKEITLPSCGLSPETEFDLSLNGSEPLVDSGQSLSSCGIVSGDLICVILAQVGKPAPSVGSSSSDTSPTRQCEEQPPVAELPSEAGTSSGHVQIEEEDTSDLGLFNPEPMLCSEAEEGKVPHSLDVLYHRAQGRGPCDSIMVAAHCLMLETGFVPLVGAGLFGCEGESCEFSVPLVHTAMNLPAVFGPTALPPELLLRVLRLLDVASVVALSAVNRDLHIATADPSLWRHGGARGPAVSTPRTGFK